MNEALRERARLARELRNNFACVTIRTSRKCAVAEAGVKQKCDRLGAVALSRSARIEIVAFL